MAQRVLGVLVGYGGVEPLVLETEGREVRPPPPPTPTSPPPPLAPDMVDVMRWTNLPQLLETRPPGSICKVLFAQGRVGDIPGGVREALLALRPSLANRLEEDADDEVIDYGEARIIGTVSQGVYLRERYGVPPLGLRDLADRILRSVPDPAERAARRRLEREENARREEEREKQNRLELERQEESRRRQEALDEQWRMDNVPIYKAKKLEERLSRLESRLQGGNK